MYKPAVFGFLYRKEVKNDSEPSTCQVCCCRGSEAVNPALEEQEDKAGEGHEVPE